MKKKKIILIATFLVIIVIAISSYFFVKNDYKNLNLGNTIDKSIDGIGEYILNISSYKAQVEVKVVSNKNENKYMLEQKYVQPNIYQQEVLEPSNIQGLKITYDGKDLKVENTKLSLTQLYENYPYLEGNILCLNEFINEYKQAKDVSITEDSNQVIMKVKRETQNRYQMYKTLYIDKKTAKPTKMEIQDVNQNTLVYISYKEIKINSTNKEEILAFRLNGYQEEI